MSALEVLAANDVVAMIDSADRYTPTPAVSHAILAFNRGRDADLADGIVVTPSHNPPRDGGFKYNPPNGGPADTDATGVIAKRANEILRDGLKDVKRVPLARALQTAQRHDYMDAYVEDLPNVVDIHAIRAEGIRIGADPLGGASVDYWGAIAERAQPGVDGGQSAGRRDVAVHDAGHRRQDPDGLQLAQRDGVADRQAATTTRSPPATTPTPTGTASSPPTAG